MKRRFEILLCSAVGICLAFVGMPAGAEELWKYTDKNGKVTYSDKAPKDGEKAEKVNLDTTGTVIPAAKNSIRGAEQSGATVDARAAEREALRERYRKSVDAAREELEKARKALEDGREATQEERQIVVGRGKDGKPTGSNALQLKPEYYDRIATLEAAVKAAEENVAAAERNARQNAPK
jgi:Domain of unknown function (DUF4124)